MKYIFSCLIIVTTLHLIFVLYLIKGWGEKKNHIVTTGVSSAAETTNSSGAHKIRGWYYLIFSFLCSVLQMFVLCLTTLLVSDVCPLSDYSFGIRCFSFV